MAKQGGFFQTSHRTFPAESDFPKVVIDRDPRLPKPAPSIRWYGRAIGSNTELTLPDKIQFLFGLAIELEADPWHYYEYEKKHETFRVAYVGKPRDWDQRGAIPGLVDAFNIGIDDYIALLTSGEVIVPEKLAPSTFAVKLVTLADKEGVVIVPREFKNFKVLREELERTQQIFYSNVGVESMLG